MTGAYDKLYVEDAQRALADMLDYAVNTLKYNLKFFYHMFLQSSLSKRFARGDVSVISGKSGVEIAREVIEENTKAACEEGACYTMDRSPEYWTGWALAYYQWYCGNDFDMIEKEICIDDICALYHPFHEMDISQFVDRMNEKTGISLYGLFEEASHSSGHESKGACYGSGYSTKNDSTV